MLSRWMWPTCSVIRRQSRNSVGWVLMLYGVRVGVLGLFSIVQEFSCSVYDVPRVSVSCVSSHCGSCVLGSLRLSEFSIVLRG